MTNPPGDPPKRPTRPPVAKRAQETPSDAEGSWKLPDPSQKKRPAAPKAADGEQDWKLPDPSQVRRGPVAAPEAESNTARDRRPWLLFIALVAIALSGTVFVVIELKPEILPISPLLNARRAEPWIGEPGASGVFGEQWKRAQHPDAPAFGRFAVDYWQSELGERRSGYGPGGGEFQQRKKDLWRSFANTYGIFGVEQSGKEFIEALRAAEADRAEIQASQEERRLPDGGLRTVNARILFKVPMTGGRLEGGLLSGAVDHADRVRLLFSPYEVNIQGDSSSVSQRELPEKFQGPISRVNPTVTLENSSMFINCDLLGIQALRPDGSVRTTLVRR